jgi:hypothetical protein
MTTPRDDLQLLYICYFGRPGDPDGLRYWSSQGVNQAAFSRMVYGQAEFQQTVLNLDTRTQVNALYLNLFGRNGDTEGLSYWTSEIERGRLSLATLGIDLIYSARQLANADASTLSAKLSAANSWTDRISENVNLSLNYQPTSWSPWNSGTALISGRSLLSGVTGASTLPSTTKLDKALVSVQARSGLPQDLASTYSQLSGQAQSLIDPATLSYATVSAGSVTMSTSEWSRYSAKPNWSTGDLGYTHYYYLHNAGDAYSLTSTERSVWQAVFSDLDSGPQHVLPIRFSPVSSARDATLVLYNNPVRSGTTLGATNRPISSADVVSGFWQTITTYRDTITGYVGGNSTSYSALYRFIALHELGHALGLDHPFENTLWPGFRATDNPSTSGPRPSETVMTYNFNLATIASQYSSTDQQALQYLWGTPSSPNLAFSEAFQAVARQATQDQSYQPTASAVPFVI